jgi:hypothetical protein
MRACNVAVGKPLATCAGPGGISFITVACLVGSLLFAEPLVARAVFLCPTGHGLCAWDAEAGWSTIWTDEGGGPISHFSQTQDGRLVVLLRGHQDPGQIVVLSAGGVVLGKRNLFSPFRFAALVGENADSALLICGGAAERVACDLILPHMDQPSTSPIPEFPLGCLFPRFRPSGAGICIPMPPAVTVMMQDGTTKFFKGYRLSLSIAGVSEILVLDETSFLLLVDNALYLWRDGRLSAIESMPVLWLRMVAGRVFVARVRGLESSATSYELCELAANTQLRTVWSDRQLAPQRVESSGRGTFVLDTWGSGVRELVSLEGPVGSVRSRVLWATRDPRLW